MPIAINMNEFPDNLPIYIDTTYRLKLLRRFYNEIKKILNSKKMSRWKLGVSNLGNLKPYCLPLNFYKRLFNEVSIPLSELVDHILFYGDPRGITVHSPKIPIMNTPEFNSVFAHLLGDGSKDGRYMQKYFLPVREFVDEVEKSFGTLVHSYKPSEIFISKKKDGRIFYHTRLPPCIMRILESKYNVKFGTFDGRIPEELKLGDDENLKAILRAFLIDEGCISGHISIASYNKDLLQDLSDVCKKLEIKHSVYEKNIFLYSREKLFDLLPLSIDHKDRLLSGYKKINHEVKFLDINLRKKRILYYLFKHEDGVSPRDLMMFSNEVPSFYTMTHRMIKEKLLTRRNKKYYPAIFSNEFMKKQSTREMILLELYKNPRTAKELSKKTGKTFCSTMQKQLWKLERVDIVKREPKINEFLRKEFLWKLTEKGDGVVSDILKWNGVSLP